MTDISYWDRFTLFLRNVPKTVKETFIWLLFSYLIPLVNIGIIWGIQGDNFEFTLNIYSIIIITNACFFTSLYYLAFTNDNNNNKPKNDRRLTKTINIVTYVVTVVLFTVSIIETEKTLSIFDLNIYKFGATTTFSVALLLGLISKYDEVEAFGILRANQSKAVSETTVGKKKIKLDGNN
ncbi:MAG: hypothetical protein WDA29_10895 [Flavobacteriaceae bacterium]